MKKLAITGMVSVVLASSLMADVVSKANDGLGDFLIAPVYQAKNDVCSEIRILNTNETASILAKVTFRERISSQEVDLPIFLSPGDVWSGTVCNVNGHAVLRSTDDSNHPAAKSVLANGKDLDAQSIAAGHTNVDFTTGYVEVYPIAEFREGSKAKVDKKVLVDRWNALIAGNTNLPKLKKDGVDGYSLTGQVLFKDGWNAPVTAVQPMTAFKGTHDKQLTGSVISYGNDTSVETLLGAIKKQQLLKVMQNSTAVVSYDNYGKDQFITFTYPFSYTEGQARKYKVIVRDMEENKDIKTETIIFSPAPIRKSQNMINEVTTLSVADIISKTKNPDMFRKGQIQVQDITNITNVQLGAGKYASFLATNVRTAKNEDKNIIINAGYAITK
jgi:hypothetical protein